ncbi:class I SAM-dependent DNA methyltransferase [Pseudonocardia tropica]|uniref:site-specific DNA-methyltransferase (adenine-specific) n=1 Tax=Pseudonocardia tropica TaxID=681289 RepID=A0ABV1JVS9_9PSEU
MTSGLTFTDMPGAIWKVADLLRGDYKRHEYGGVILPFTLLRRLDAQLAPTRAKVRERDAQLGDMRNKRPLLERAAGLPYYNVSQQDFTTMSGDATGVAKNVRDYVNGFSDNIRQILAAFDFDNEITKLAGNKLLYKVVAKFNEFEGLEKLDSHEMGYVFEHLIRKFAEDSNETAGEHFTPREVIRLMVNLLFAPDDRISEEGQVINILDPACGTGGMLTAADEAIRSMNPRAEVYLYGQEVNPESWAIGQSDMLMSSHRGEIALANTFSDPAYGDRKFDYMLANPPFGVEWKKVKDDVENEAELGPAGRFGAGLPRINDGSFLFLQHMISKMEPADGKGSRLAIVFNGSPLFTGAAGSGESRIRQWILESDLLEGIVALPDQLFYNTGISTYFWILSNRKRPALKDKVILLDARDQWVKMRKSLGDKRKEISADQIKHVTELYDKAVDVAADPEHPDHAKVKIFGTREFGYQRITVERPLRQRFEITEDTLVALEYAKPLAKWADRDEFIEALRGHVGTVWATKKEAGIGLRDILAGTGILCPSTQSILKGIWGAVAVSDPEGEYQLVKGERVPDPDLRDYENVPLNEDLDRYFQREVVAHVADAWIDHEKTRIGFEIPFTRTFYVRSDPRLLAEIDADLKFLEARIQGLLGEVAG